MLKPLAAALACLVAGAAIAQDATEAKVRDAIKSLVPNAEIESVSDSVLPGFSEVIMNGQVIYVTDDGQYVVSGAVFDVAGKANLTERRLGAVRVAELKKVPPERRLIFPAKSPKHNITVFTDIDCGYCRQFHADIQKYNDLGITVEYLFFPRMGQGSKGWNEAVQVWCSKDRNDALTQAKAGRSLDAKTDCDNPVNDDFVLGQRIGVSGTPAIFSEAGTQVGGYLPPDQMLARLEQDKATRK
jgi:thiol:disulfide interchange protein DsbC